MTIVKIIELVGSSRVSADDVVEQTVMEAQRAPRHISSVDEWRVRVRIGFRLERVGG